MYSKKWYEREMIILFISEHSHTEIGGIANHIYNVGKTLEKQGIKIVYLNAQELSDISIFNKKIVFKRTLRKYFESILPDVVHIHGFSSFFVNVCLSVSKKILPNAKLVYTPHYHPFSYHTHPLLATLFFHAFLKKSLENIDALIALTQTEQAFFEQYINVDKIQIIPNGINIPLSVKVKKKPKKNNLLFIGRDDHNKRLDFLLNQKDIFRERAIHCNIVTDQKKLSDEVFSYYSNLSESQLEDLYRNCAVLVIPSKYEAFSIVALEAMAWGTPILISDRVQIKSYLLDKGKFNKIFRYDDASDFIEKLESILNLSAEAYQQLAKKNIEFTKSFDWGLVVKKLLLIYKE